MKWVLEKLQSISKKKLLKLLSHHHRTVTSKYQFPLLGLFTRFSLKNDFQLPFYILLNSITLHTSEKLLADWIVIWIFQLRNLKEILQNHLFLLVTSEILVIFNSCNFVGGFQFSKSNHNVFYNFIVSTNWLIYNSKIFYIVITAFCFGYIDVLLTEQFAI